jgi:membrane-bound lytic murein transglycosylase C
MSFRLNAKLLAALLAVELMTSCATTKVVGTNIQRVANGGSVDQKELTTALASDTKDMEANLATLHSKFEAAYAVLKTNVQKRWGQNDAKVANRTVYVKYTQGYKSRVVTDFDHGFLIVETVDDKNPEASLRTAIIAALLTSNDPASVDLFSDKDVTIDANRRPYLYGLVVDNQGKPIRTREQAEHFADYLMAQKLQTKTGKTDQGDKTTRFVKVTMVRNFEVKGADRYRAAVDKYSTQYHVSPSLVLAIMRTESNFNPFAVSAAPAYGLMQLVPTSGGRAAYKRVQGIDQAPTAEYLYDPDHNIELGAAYLSVLSNAEFKAVTNQESRDYCVIAAYNTGAGNVTKTFSKDRATAFNTINSLDPPILFANLRTNLPLDETRQYVVKVTGYRKQFVTVVEPTSTQ